jgi:predicted metal-dependent phosphoesterase TrpH
MISPWSQPGFWFKGALHVHTTNSDGKLSAAQVAEAYRRHGYDFIALTDHERVTPAGEAAAHLTVLGGAEVAAGRSQLGAAFHLLALGLSAPLPADLDRSSAQAALDGLRALGALVFIAHPYWSMLSAQDLLGLREYHGLEVFNAGCQFETRHGEASQHWDWLLGRGRTCLGISVDDAHFGYWDAAAGWVMVRATSPWPADLLAALQAGHFYSSAGPVIEALDYAAGRLYLRCSPCVAVHVLLPQEGRGWSSHQLGRRPPGFSDFTELDFPAPPPGALFRLELLDRAGRKAWTNPLVVE